MTIKQLTADCIINDIELVTGLLSIGANRVSEGQNTYEAIVMRAARQILRDLNTYVQKQSLQAN